MKKHLFVAMAAALLLIGCASSPPAGTAGDPAEPSRLATTLRDIGGAPAALAVAEPMRPFFATGLGFIVLGGLVAGFGGRGAGAVLLGLGLATTATGVLFVQYPWAVLVLALFAGVVAAVAAWDRIRARRALAEADRELKDSRDALAATAEVIQNVPEGRAIKAALAGLGKESEDKVRQVINPIKEKLRREGRIGG